jgi:hypothetical protein
MRQTPSTFAKVFRRLIGVLGLLVFLEGVFWFWSLRESWPRAFHDPVPQPVLEAAGVMIGGLYLASKGDG